MSHHFGNMNPNKKFKSQKVSSSAQMMMKHKAMPSTKQMGKMMKSKMKGGESYA